ncbi:hypothetical protein [Cohnella zeiphila]|uniref:General stress protein 17M-like domain-containing protein n=1 Tax=Cohnella zeiphila TaxID=2761120 RepID=A0A7X0SL19_9BACL|nr:hypothetical protein [Cohnella zeiphila]MBB6731975.1 hypothetical protein [Cohnella zeiphila]
MTRTIGIFEQEDQVLEAIDRLRASGLEEGQLRVIVKNDEDAPLLSAKAEVPMEEVAGLRETAERSERDGALNDEAVILPAAAWYGTSQSSGTTGGTAPIAAFGLAYADPGEDSERLVEEMGVPSHFADECSEALGQGKYLLMAESEHGGEESPMRDAGAKRVLQ